MKENKKELTGSEIADLIIRWANKNNIHPDDFENMFTRELIDLMDEKEKK